MRADLATVAELTARIYESAYDQGRWQGVVDGLRDAFEGSRACITRIGPAAIEAVATDRSDNLVTGPAFTVFSRDPVMLASAAMPLGRPFQRSSIADDDFSRRELWIDWLEPRDMHDCLMANLPGGGGSQLLVSVDRHSRSPIDTDDWQLFEILLPHILRAGALSNDLQQLGIMGTFWQMERPLALVDAGLKVKLINPAAERLLARPGAPLAVLAGELQAADMDLDRKLTRLVGTAAASENPLTPIGGTMVVGFEAETSPGEALVVSVLPFGRAEAYGLPHRQLALVALRPVGPHDARAFGEQLIAAFGLSPTEARLATTLAAGRSLQDAAVSGGVTVKTARTYLERIFRKTGTGHQGQLVALLKSVEPIA
jgi:DNA-binding CsgD family transcriptional regulator